MSRVIGIVTLSDLARNVSDHLGEPSGETVRALMRPAAAVPPDTPVTEIAEAIAGDGIIVVSRPDGRPAGYVTAESVLTQAVPGTSSQPGGDHPGLLVVGDHAIRLWR